MSLQTMTGLDFIKAMAAGQIPPASIAETMPMKCILAEKGLVLFEATANEKHLNPLGGVHGGFAATVLDSVTGCAVHTQLEAGERYATIDLNIKMVRPLPQHETLFSEGQVINISKNIAITEGKIKDKDGKLYAHATATCMIIR